MNLDHTSSQARELFARAESIPGWFNLFDCGHWCLLLGYQAALGVEGDLLEIGAHHGRSAAVLASFLRPGETLVIADVCDYRDRASAEQVADNIERVAPGTRSSVDLRVGFSRDLSLGGQLFRFCHIDGGTAGAKSLRQAQDAWQQGINLVEYAQEHAELKGAFASFQADADQFYPGWREVLKVGK